MKHITLNTKKLKKKKLIEIAQGRKYLQITPYTEKENGLWIACIEGLHLLSKNRKKDGKIKRKTFTIVEVLHIMHTAFDAGILSTKPEKENSCPLPQPQDAPVSEK